MRKGVQTLIAVLLLWGTAAAQPVRVTFWHIFDSGEPQAFITQVVDDFNASHPDIVVEHLGTNFFDYWTRLTTATAAGTGPDVAINDLGNVPARAETGIISPLDSFMERDGLSLDAYWPATRPVVQYDQQTYALPWETDVRVLYYNKALFAEAGLDPETPPQTWDELADYSDRLTVTSNAGRLERVGFSPTLGNLFLYPLVWLNGGDFVDEEGNLVLNTPESVEALQWMVDRFNAYGSREMQSFAASFSGGANDPFLAGRVAMIAQNNTFVSQIETYAPDLDYGVAPLPNNGTPASWSNGFTLEMSANTSQPDAAWEFMKYLMSDEVQEEYAKVNGSMVGNIAAATSETLLADPVWQVLVDQMEVSRFRPFAREAPTWYDTALQPEIDAALLGQKTPEQALDDAQSAYEAEVARFQQTQ